MHGQRDEFFCLIYKEKRSYNGFYRIFEILPVLDHFDDELGGEDKRIEPQSWGGTFEE
jgi:hypothetical protein